VHNQRPRSRGCMEVSPTHIDHSARSLLRVHGIQVSHTPHAIYSTHPLTVVPSQPGVHGRASVAGLHELVANELHGVTCGHVVQPGHRVIACMQQHRFEGALH
jgi:hypothetical protein